jgi:uncharacterized membrane protein (DUF485 family)
VAGGADLPAILLSVVLFLWFRVMTVIYIIHANDDDNGDGNQEAQF